MRTPRDKLSHLTFRQACRLLGPEGQVLISEGGRFEIDLFRQVHLDDRLFRLTLPDVFVDIALSEDKLQRLDIRCSRCPGACTHKGADPRGKAAAGVVRPAAAAGTHGEPG